MSRMDITTTPKDSEPALHQSQVDTLLSCGVLFENVYLRGIRKPSPGALVIGTAMHKVRAASLLRKRDAGEQLSVEEAGDLAASEFDARVAEEGIETDPDIGDRAKTIGVSKDMAVQLSQAHERVLTPTIVPVHVEKSIRVRVPGIRRPIEGTLDTVDAEGRLRDAKSSKDAYKDEDVYSSIQFPTYSMLFEVEFGKKPTRIVADVVQKPAKTIGPRAYSVEVPAVSDYRPVLGVFARAEKIIDAGLFAPAARGSWKCSPRWCSFFNDCPFGKAQRTAFAVSDSQPKETT